MKKLYKHILNSIVLSMILVCSPLSSIIAQGTFTDHEGNEYKTVTIGELEWMAENYRASTFTNGDSIAWIADDATWDTVSKTNGEPAMGVVDNDSANLDIYGPVYNWYALADARGFAPEGWRVATDADWQSLETYIGIAEADLSRDGWAGADTNAAGQLQADSAGVYWDADSTYEKTNSTGFSWIGGAIRYGGGGWAGHKVFSSIWTADEANETFAWRRLARYDRADIRRHAANKGSGFNVRLVRDAVTTSIEDGLDQPKGFKLDQNYPNPFNPTTILSYSVPQSSMVKLTVYDMIGRQISVLVNEMKSAGSHQVRFDASNLSSGIYIYRLEAGNISMTKKMTLMK